QVADAHSGLYYNYFRDYDPETGRYVESDPIGVDGGLNTYGYVEGNPIGFMDQYGLESAALNPTDFLKPYTYPTWLRGIPAIITIPAAVGTFCLVYPNNSLAGPELAECGDNCQYAKQDSGKNEKHGDLGRAKDKTREQIEELEQLSRNATGRERQKLEQKIKNIKRTAEKKQKAKNIAEWENDEHYLELDTKREPRPSKNRLKHRCIHKIPRLYLR
ncbi:RHS repeat-associated core domain-containing protein, partial [Metapseudomonas otitidis]|uniref:RHS repeat-associated core domain-containing protein n=1 Tax=Metapseudomonas otitidis TaxID=319939 RepID=UPI00244B727E